MSKSKRDPRVSKNPYKGGHGPRVAAEPTKTVSPRVLKQPGEDGAMRTPLVFCHSQADHDWPHPVSDCPASYMHDMYMKLKDFETMRPAEIWTSSTGHNVYPAEGWNHGIATRMQHLKLDDETAVRSLRLTGAGRVFGVLRGNVYYVLWLDPAHQVCPYTKKNT